MSEPQVCELCADCGYDDPATHKTEDGMDVCEGCWLMLWEQMPEEAVA